MNGAIEAQLTNAGQSGDKQNVELLVQRIDRRAPEVGELKLDDLGGHGDRKGTQQAGQTGWAQRQEHRREKRHPQYAGADRPCQGDHHQPATAQERHDKHRNARRRTANRRREAQMQPVAYAQNSQIFASDRRKNIGERVQQRWRQIVHLRVDSAGPCVRRRDEYFLNPSGRRTGGKRLDDWHCNDHDGAKANQSHGQRCA